MAASFVVSLLALAPLTLAQDHPNICQWQQIRAGVVRDSLYLEGGLRLDGTWSASTNTYDGCETTLVQDGRLFKLNFSKSFDVESTDFKNLFEVVPENPDNTAPFYVDGGFFGDDQEFYTIGGLAYPGATNTTPAQGAVRAGLYQDNELATSFAPSVNPYYGNIPASISKFITHGAGVSIPSENLGFYFSGLSTGNPELPLDYLTLGNNDPNRADTLVTTMLKVDTTTSNNAVWQELPLSSNVTGGNITRAGASMVWIPTGPQGALVVLGGTLIPGDLWNYQLTDQQVVTNNNRSSSFVATVPVYDIAGNTWYTVETKGTPQPPPFVQACAVVASAADGSSHQIYVYGGYGRANAAGTSGVTPSDDVWILSVPSFTWIQAARGDGNHGRYAHTCAKPYPNQMITVGGSGWAGTSLRTTAVVDNFDLNTLSWTGRYDPTEYANYSVPSVVYDVIGGDADGGATVPSDLDTELSALFGTRYSKPIATWYPYAAEPTAAAATPRKKSIAVAVAVPVVIVVVLLVAAISAWFCYFSPAAKRKRSQKSSDDTAQGSESFVSKWVSSSGRYPPPPPKSVISSDATEIGESLSPRAEVAGFSYFTPHARPGAAEVDGAPLYGGTATGAPYTRAASPGSPRSHGSAELEGVPTPPAGMSEILENQRNTEVFRHHPFYPPSIGGQSASSSALASRFANARAPSDTASNAIELPPNRSTENVGLVPPPSDLNRSKSDKSHTETSTDISAPTDSDADARVIANQSSSGVRTPDWVSQQPLSVKETAAVKQQGGKSYPPTALSNIASQSKTPHHRSTSSASSGIAMTLSPTTSENFTTIDPAEDQRRSDAISLLPDHISRNVVPNAEQDKADDASRK